MSPIEERFWSKVRKTSGCWLWTASCHRTGYGQFRVGPRTVKSHRMAWELSRGPIPSGLCVLHKCDNPACVNPDHLFLGTQLDNIVDRCQKGRTRVGKGERHGSKLHPESVPRGKQHPHAKFTEEQVKAIRYLIADGYGHRQLARFFKVDHKTIGSMIRGRTWRHV